MLLLGNDYVNDYVVIIGVVSIFVVIRNINFNFKDNCIYCKIGF